MTMLTTCHQGPRAGPPPAATIDSLAAGDSPPWDPIGVRCPREDRSSLPGGPVMLGSQGSLVTKGLEVLDGEIHQRIKDDG